MYYYLNEPNYYGNTTNIRILIKEAFTRFKRLYQSSVKYYQVSLSPVEIA